MTMGNRSGRRDGLHEVLGRSLNAGGGGGVTAVHTGAGNVGAHRTRWWALRGVAALVIGLAVLVTVAPEQAAAQSSTESVFDQGRFLLGNLEKGASPHQAGPCGRSRIRSRPRRTTTG